MNSPDIFALFGKPPVLATENLAAYETLRGYAVAQVLPCDFLEYANLRRYVDLTWEALRYQRCAAAIINITCWDALNRLVRELAQDGIKGLTADQMVQGWFSDTTVRMQVSDGLRRYGFDEDTVMAVAMAMRSAELARISEMRTRAGMREIERHREGAARRTPALVNAPASEQSIDGRPAT
jgi:hypothetical protein